MENVIDKIVSNAQTHWITKDAPLNHIVISSRIRLARNLAKIPVPAFQDDEKAFEVLSNIKKAAESLEVQKEFKLSFIKINELSELNRRILFEKHLISREHMESGHNRGLLINPQESVSIMINEEDHLRIQVLFPGLQLEKAWEVADQIDDLLESKLEYAFHEEKGYLTACPTNVGTGLRASVMVHLPALVLTKQATRIFGTLGQLGLVVRGLYGEGTEAVGNVFQISNQITLGQKETEIIQNLTTVTKQIFEKEEETRRVLLKEAKIQIKDRVGRAFGILQNAAILNSQEFLALLSDVRLGLDLGLLDFVITPQQLTELIIRSQPGFLQGNSGNTMDSMERDVRRAKLFNDVLKGDKTNV